MFEILKSGGLLVWPIVACSIIALAIICERLWSLRAGSVQPAGLLQQIREGIESRNLDRDRIAEIRRSSPLGRVLAAGLINAGKNRLVMKDSIEEEGRAVVHGLERNLNALGTIATITPLLGLLGTVIGMIKVFSAITAAGVGNSKALAGGISEALITTAAGLSVGILSLMFYRYFKGRVNGISVDMEQEAMKLVNYIHRDTGKR